MRNSADFKFINDFTDDCQIPIRNHVFFLDMRSERILQSGDIVQHGGGARMVCLSGYELHGNDKFECSYGSFTQQIGHCRPSMDFIFVLV